MKKTHFILNSETGELVCKGQGGVGWAFTIDIKKAVKFTAEKAERMEVYAKFDASAIEIEKYINRPKSKAFQRFLEIVNKK
jgi:hypothetical protein